MGWRVCAFCSKGEIIPHEAPPLNSCNSASIVPARARFLSSDIDRDMIKVWDAIRLNNRSLTCSRPTRSRLQGAAEITSPRWRRTCSTLEHGATATLNRIHRTAHLSPSLGLVPNIDPGLAGETGVSRLTPCTDSMD
jgi:hypothetical protein